MHRHRDDVLLPTAEQQAGTQLQTRSRASRCRAVSARLAVGQTWAARRCPPRFLKGRRRCRTQRAV